MKTTIVACLALLAAKDGILSLAIRENAERLTSEARGLHEPGDGSLLIDSPILFWTWNSAGKNVSLDYAAERLAQSASDSGAKMIVTCQTEAMESVYSSLAPFGWKLTAGGRHSGSTGLNGGEVFNEQILAVFVKSIFEVDASASKETEAGGGGGYVSRLKQWAKGEINEGTGKVGKMLRWISGKGKLPSMSVRFPGSSSVMVTDSFLYHADMKGKGGVGARLTDGEASLHVACAHLDSDSFDARNLQVDGFLEKFPDGATAQVMLGDLNYRLQSTAESKLRFQLLGMPGERPELARYDPLDSAEAASSLLSKHNFQCNSPYKLYPPTYKRGIDEMECRDLTSKGAVQTCYASGLKSLSKEKRQGWLEVGWLDRLCWTIRKPGYSVEMLSDLGWEDELRSDHMPVAWTMQLRPSRVE
mmetsp:Transcript_17730/g.31019  ORF Transcript_17730/g.31019 Transcript_17730/m.31019 type:complete len:417 (+) Transcript_17730:117-1367(+)